MSLPDKCPFCGAAIAVGDDGKKRVADLCVIFDCGSGFHELMDPIRTRSRVCKDITRLAARVAELEEANRSNRVVMGGLSAVLDAWKDHCKRLEEVGDMIVAEYMVVEPEKSAWKQAKEAKP